jgi:hypothetical protein
MTLNHLTGCESGDALRNQTESFAAVFLEAVLRTTVLLCALYGIYIDPITVSRNLLGALFLVSDMHLAIDCQPQCTR